jgi:lipid II:glycine glycyltransferase (peptidoglycan interpeptide bridge formation enzyme)
MIPFAGTGPAWNELIASLPLPHLLQTWEWAQVKAAYGWKPHPCIWPATQRPAAAAMILKRTVPLGGFAARLSVLYVPKGPNLDWSDAPLRRQVLDDLQAFARRQGAIFIKIDPDVPLGTGAAGAAGALEDGCGQAVRSELERRGWLFSQDQVQFRNTVLIDLDRAEDELLARMKQKTRYNVRLAQKKGVTVRRGTLEDSGLLYRMYAETSVRDGFLIRGEDYYRTVWQTFSQSSFENHQSTVPFTEPLIAEVEGQPVAALSMFYFAGQAYYLYGMSRQAHRERMPNYLLQWEAIRRARELGCRVYNLWGAPDEFDESDRLWGVYRFKEGLGGYVSRTLGAWDYASSPLLYKLYTRTLPRILGVMRRRGQRRTEQSLGA